MEISNLVKEFTQMCKNIEKFDKGYLFYQNTDPLTEDFLVSKGYIEPFTTEIMTINIGLINMNHYIWTKKGQKICRLTSPIRYFLNL